MPLVAAARSFGAGTVTVVALVAVVPVEAATVAWAVVAAPLRGRGLAAEAVVPLPAEVAPTRAPVVATGTATVIGTPIVAPRVSASIRTGTAGAASVETTTAGPTAEAAAGTTAVRTTSFGTTAMVGTTAIGATGGAAALVETAPGATPIVAPVEAAVAAAVVSVVAPVTATVVGPVAIEAALVAAVVIGAVVLRAVATSVARTAIVAAGTVSAIVVGPAATVVVARWPAFLASASVILSVFRHCSPTSKHHAERGSWIKGD